MDVTEDTIPELQPVFTFLNSHSNKLYQEGYFLKLDDQNTRTSLPPQAAQWPFPCSCRKVDGAQRAWPPNPAPTPNKTAS